MGIAELVDLFGRKVGRDDFVRRVLKRLRRLPGVSDIALNATQFSVSFKYDGRERVLYLDNAYLDYQKESPLRRSRVIDAYLSALSFVPADVSKSDALSQLRVVIRRRSMLELIALERRLRDRADTDADTPYAPFCGDLVLALGLDVKEAVGTVQAGMLVKWGLDFDSALRIGTENLREHTKDNFFEARDGLYVSAWQDAYDASRVVLTDMLHRLPIKGRPVVSLPSRNHLLVTGDANELGLVEMVQLAAEIFASETRPLHAGLLVLTDGKWTELNQRIEGDDALVELRYHLLSQEYGHQKDLLDAIHEREGKRLHVAPQNVLALEAGPTSTALWKEGMPTLLPRAEQLLLASLSVKEALAVEWTKAWPIIGEPMRARDLYPERFLVTEFPGEKQFAQLRAVATLASPIDD